jgi:hypothetical protein
MPLIREIEFLELTAGDVFSALVQPERIHELVTSEAKNYPEVIKKELARAEREQNIYGKNPFRPPSFTAHLLTYKAAIWTPFVYQRLPCSIRSDRSMELRQKSQMACFHLLTE